MPPKAINGASLAAVEQQIEGRQVRDESAVQLRVDRMRVPLPLDTDAVCARTARRRDSSARSRRSRYFDAPKLRQMLTSRSLRSPPMSSADERSTRVRSPNHPAISAAHAMSRSTSRSHLRCSSSSSAGRYRSRNGARAYACRMLATCLRAHGVRPSISTSRIRGNRRSAVANRHGQPLRAVLRLDAVAVPPAMLVVLHVVVIDEHVGTPQLIEEPEPRQVAGLQDDDRGSSEDRSIARVSRPTPATHPTRRWRTPRTAETSRTRANGRAGGAGRSSRMVPAGASAATRSGRALDVVRVGDSGMFDEPRDH